MNYAQMDTKELMNSDRRLTLALEETEAVYWSKYYYTDEKLPCFATVIAGAFAGSVPEVDVLAMNRVIGLGMSGEVKPKDIENIIKFYKTTGAKRFFVQLSPHVFQSDLPMMLRKAGFNIHNHWVKLMKKLNEPIALSPCGLRIERIADDYHQKQDYAHILYESFGWENPRLKMWLGKTFGQIGYRHYLAYQGDKPIAAAALHIMGGYASLAFAGTLPAYRGLGAQRALIELRLLEALEAGCDYIITETAVPTSANPAQSYKNMISHGFQEVYQRENWIYILD